MSIDQTMQCQSLTGRSRGEDTRGGGLCAWRRIDPASVCRAEIFSRMIEKSSAADFRSWAAEKTGGPWDMSTVIETVILDHALAHPCHGPMRVAQELVLRGIQVSSGGVRG